MARIAHFLLVPELAGSPPNKAAITAWLHLGHQVDVFSPEKPADVSVYGPKVTSQKVAYGYKWMLRHSLSPRWARYDAFSGTTEKPLAVAGLLSQLHRRPLITFADEIYAGSYFGTRSEGWKSLCRRGMRRACLTVVNEEERVALQRDYAGMTGDQKIVVYPGCFHQSIPAGDRLGMRRSRGIPDDALVLSYSGVFNQGNGGLWLTQALERSPNLWVWGQILHRDPLVLDLLRQARGSERLVLEPNRLDWEDAWASMAAVDIGQVVYLQDAPQFRHMGTASNRLCMFLSMGVPVIASRQPSFAFIEDYDCGVLIDNSDQFPKAVEQIAAKLPAMKANALTCAKKYLRAAERYEQLKSALEVVLKPH